MIIKIISKYLESNKRLVIPNLGTFIVKEEGHKVLFSNLMKTDDGVLRKLLIEHGVSELEAAGTIDRFVFEVNFRLDRDGVCGLDRFGALKRGANSTISFIINPAAQGEVLDGGLEEHLTEKRVAEAEKSSKPEKEEEAEKIEKVEVKTEQREIVEDDGEEIVIKVVSKGEPEKKPARELILDNENLTASTQKRPASYVKGLRYGKEGKIVTGREYATSGKSKAGDIIMKIAIAAALIAMLALGYGMWCDWKNMQSFGSETVEEGIFDEPISTAEKGIENPDLQYIQK